MQLSTPRRILSPSRNWSSGGWPWVFLESALLRHLLASARKQLPHTVCPAGLRWEGALVLRKLLHLSWSSSCQITLPSTLMLPIFQFLKPLPPFLFLLFLLLHWNWFFTRHLWHPYCHSRWRCFLHLASLTSWQYKWLTGFSFWKLSSLGFSLLWFCFSLCLLLLHFVCWPQFLHCLIAGVPQDCPRHAYPGPSRHLLFAHSFRELISCHAFHCFFYANDPNFLSSSLELLSEFSNCLADICIWMSHLKIDLVSVSFLTLFIAVLSFVYCTSLTLICIYLPKHTKLFTTSGSSHMLFMLPESLCPLFLHVYLLLILKSQSTCNLLRMTSLDNLPKHYSVILDHYSLLSSQS